jgi:hypothetical protein
VTKKPWFLFFNAVATTLDSGAIVARFCILSVFSFSPARISYHPLEEGNRQIAVLPQVVRDQLLALEYEWNGRQREENVVLLPFLLIWLYRRMDEKRCCVSENATDSDELSTA